MRIVKEDSEWYYIIHENRFGEDVGYKKYKEPPGDIEWYHWGSHDDDYVIFAETLRNLIPHFDNALKQWKNRENKLNRILKDELE